jgi:hypothetical protein
VIHDARAYVMIGCDCPQLLLASLWISSLIPRQRTDAKENSTHERSGGTDAAVDVRTTRSRWRCERARGGDAP